MISIMKHLFEDGPPNPLRSPTGLVKSNIGNQPSPTIPTPVENAAAAAPRPISAGEHANEAISKGIRNTGHAAGDFAHQVGQAAQEHPIAGALVAGAAGALGINKLLNRRQNS